jgi:hypothetical protein
MSRASPRIQKSRSVAETVGLLTAGLVVVSPGSRFVLVEDELDLDFYETIRQLLSDFGPSRDPRAIRPAPSLIFVPPLSEIIRGVIDRDTGNAATSRIEVIGRHSIENYLLDPIVVFCLLSSAKRAPAIDGLQISTGDEHLIREQPEKVLTEIVTTTSRHDAHLSPRPPPSAPRAPSAWDRPDRQRAQGPGPLRIVGAAAIL